METSGITILGLGPGNPGQVTRKVWQFLEGCSELHLRTGQHPVVRDLPLGIHIHTFDSLYESFDSFEAVYDEIIKKVLELARRPQGVVYAVPGHPYVAEATAPEIVRRASVEGLPVQVFDGLSFLEPTFTALGLDPFPHSALVDAFELAGKHVVPFPPDAPAIVAQIHSAMIAADVKLTLMATYPDEHPVHLVHAAGTSKQLVEKLALYEIDRSPDIGLLTTLYVPPLENPASFEAFQELIAHLRSPHGCPWDREQTHQSMRSGVLEETYEVLAALDAEDSDSLREELGDLLLLIVFHAQIAAEAGEFCMTEIISGIHSKIVRRHPHVFGGAKIESAEDVLKNWERLKQDERAANKQSQASVMDGVSMILPALVQAQQYQQRAAQVGFDWLDIQGVLDKLHEELGEIDRAQSNQARSDEVGDLLFAAVNLARWHEVDAESALREANTRFRNRFNYVEEATRLKGKPLSEMSLDEMEALWGEAKRR